MTSIHIIKSNIKNMRLTLYIFISVLSATALFAQPIKSYKLEEMYATADEQVELGDYYNALEWYRKIYTDEKSEDVALSIGYAYYKMRDYENAERWYTRVLEKDEDNIFVDDRYAYGKVLRALGKKAEAKIEFEKFLALSDDEGLIALAQNELNGMAIESTFPNNKEVVVMFGGEEINSGNGEYSPVQYDDKTLYFSSFQRRKEIILDGSEEDYHAKIYKSTAGDKGYGKPEALSRKINRDDFHVSGISFSKDKRTMYFARQILQNDAVISSTIYRSRQTDDDWASPEPVPVINGEYLAMQPAVGELFGEEVLYFVSNRDGGFGGLDIYYSAISGDNFGAPVNLGETINSVEDDVSPSYHDGALYFSSSALPGFGNLDIYKSIWDGTKWSTPENLGNQYNSKFDDYSISFYGEGTKGYLVSNRPDEKKQKLKSETCCYDIYSFEIRQLAIDLLVGVGSMDEKPLNGATVQLFDATVEDLETKTLPEEYRFSFGLYPERKYQIITSKEGYISDTSEVSTYGITEDKSIRKKVLLKEKSKEPELPEFTLETVTINEPIRLNNIYYNFEKWDILPDAEIDLQVILDLMNEYSDMVIELSSHTDSRGNTPYNKDLSQKRAQSAKDWLVQRGIAEERINAVGYGESKILNRCVNGVRCSDDEHRFNRRTEFTITAGPQSIQIKREVKKNGPQGGKQSVRKNYVPIISFVDNHIDIGKVVAGEKKEIIFSFVNTGNEPLIIDLATACQCTDIEWPADAILPGSEGRIVAIFDSTGMEGPYTKTIDIIANTEPIVVEAKFSVEVILKEQN